MWLINTQTLILEEVTDPSSVKYAILSHTWGEEEVTFHDIRNLDPRGAEGKPKFSKILMTCEIALRRGLQYAWVDTCCIDKSSSAELSEAINSMFKWYRQSTICFVFLSDLGEPDIVGSGSGLKSSFPYTQETFAKCRWFTRGWTLQELIAPVNIEFFNSKWVPFCQKADCLDVLAEVTGIPYSVLESPSKLRQSLVAVKMSWAASRVTKRVEDRAYSLLGIFDINMPMIYGEGEKAFRRLQEEIARDTNDLSLFAWMDPTEDERNRQKFRGVFARSPSEFGGCSTMRRSSARRHSGPEFTLTNKGVQIHSKLHPIYNAQRTCNYAMYLGLTLRTLRGAVPVCISLTLTPDGFVRSNAWSLDCEQQATDTQWLRIKTTKHVQKDLDSEGREKPRSYTTIHVQKDLNSEMEKELRNRMRRSFYFCSKLPAAMTIRLPHVSPPQSWDRGFWRFISSESDKSFAAKMELTITYEDYYPSAMYHLIVIFGWNETRQKPFALLYGNNYDWTDRDYYKHRFPADFPDILPDAFSWELSRDDGTFEEAFSKMGSDSRFLTREVLCMLKDKSRGIGESEGEPEIGVSLRLELETKPDQDNMAMYHISFHGEISRLESATSRSNFKARDLAIDPNLG